MACVVTVGCTRAAEDPGVASPGGTQSDSNGVVLAAQATHAEAIGMLTGLLPEDARGVLALDLAALLSGGSSADFTALLNGDGADPALTELFGTVGALANSVDVPRVMTTALLAHTTEATEGSFLVARLDGETIDDVAADAPTPDGTYGPSAHPICTSTSNGNHLTLLPGGVLVVGAKSVVESVLDIVDGASPGGDARSPRSSTRWRASTTSASSTGCPRCSETSRPTDRSGPQP